MDSPTDVAATPGPQTSAPGPRRLRRRPDDGPIAGVCAGVAEYFDVDPVIVRIAAVVLFFSGPGLFAYVLAWIFVPPLPGPAAHGTARAPIDGKDRATQVFGIVLIVLAVSVVWGDWWSPARHWLLPLGLMALGAWLLLRRDDGADADPEPDPASTPNAPPAAWAWGGGSDDVTVPSPSASQVDGHEGEGSSAEDDTSVVDPTAVEPPPPPWASVPPPELPASAPTVAPAPSRRRVLGPIVFGALLMWAGIAVLADVTLETGLAGGLLILGVGFVLGAFVGGSRILILPALVVGAALAVTAILDIPLNGPVGRQGWAPTSLAQLDERYEVSIGEGTLDLQGIDIPTDERVEVSATVGVGHLVVLVPDGMAVEVTADIGAGESDIFGLQQNGVGFDADQSRAGDEGSGTLVLSTQVGVGQVEVRRVADLTSGEAPDPEFPLG